MKYIVYCLLALLSGFLFLPKPGTTDIRNLPILIAVICLIILYFAYRYIKFLLFANKVKKELKSNGIKVQATRLYFTKGYVVAENDADKLDICLISTKSKYYRYHFADPQNIEIYKSTSTVSKSSKKGTVAIGATYSRLVGKQKIRFEYNNTDNKANCILVMNKFPYSITDSAKREELDNGALICNSNVTLYNLTGFSNFINNKSN